MQNWSHFFTEAQFGILSVHSWFILEKGSSAYISLCVYLHFIVTHRRPKLCYTMLGERLKLFYIKIAWPVYSKFLARFLGLPSALQPQQHRCCLHEPPSSNILWFEGVILCVKHFPPHL